MIVTGFATGPTLTCPKCQRVVVKPDPNAFDYTVTFMFLEVETRRFCLYCVADALQQMVPIAIAE